MSSDKEAIFWKVLDSAIALDIRHGHLKWKMSDLARRSKVSRTLVYYYFGKDRNQMLLEAVNRFGDELAGLNERRLHYWERGEILESVIASRSLGEKLPHFTLFYFFHRDVPSDVGAVIKMIEKRMVKKIRKFLPKTSPSQADALFAVLFGLVFAPNLKLDSIQEGVRLIENFK